MSEFSALYRHPQLLLPKRHIFLLSHMRAYTSLFGHIMGSNSDICGYYEMHIGYYSWKSFLRQKLLFFDGEAYKRGSRYMFDKILHNEHAISSQILNRRLVKTIFSLRPPQQTIPSIVKLYREIEPTHEFCAPEFATTYYCERLTLLLATARQMERGFYYLDADCLVNDAGSTLAELSAWLELNSPLSESYQLQEKTSKRLYGDTSSNISSGRIVKKVNESSELTIDKTLIDPALEVFQEVRNTLVELSQCHRLA